MALISINFATELYKFWIVWNVRIFVLLSQFLQIVLYFLMPYRKRTSNSFILFLTNGTYIVSFIVASNALVYLSVGLPADFSYQPPLVLWASFVLLHLAGGGHTTAYTLDDYGKEYERFFNFLSNELILFIVICLQWRAVAVPDGWAFIAGIAYVLSWGQMVRLRSGSTDARVESLLSSNPIEEEEEATMKEGAAKKSAELHLTKMALEYYQSTRKLIQGLSFTMTEREHSRKYFLKLDPKNAFRIIQIELNLAYDSYFTRGSDPPKNKHRRVRILLSALAYRFSVLALFITLGIKISFLSHSELNEKYKRRDTIITRALCFSAVLIYLLSLLNFLSSDYVIATWEIERLAKLRHKERWWSSSTATRSRNMNSLCSFPLSYLRSLARIFFRRWSETISRRSFMIECFREATMRSSYIPRMFQRWFVTPSTSVSEWYDDDLGKFIFTNLREKATIAKDKDDAMRMFESDGKELLLKQPQLVPHEEHLKILFLDRSYDVRLLLWHIATEILYNGQGGNDSDVDRCRDMSNVLSEYMMYLTFERRNIMSRFKGNFMFKHRDISRYIWDNNMFEKWYRWGRNPSNKQLDKFYKRIIDENGGPQDIKQPVVIDAIKLAQLLRNSFKDNEKILWKVMSEVWIDMLVYAATHCDPAAHVERLAEGGELITIVWLLSAHFGFGDFFILEEKEEDHVVV